MLEEWNIYNQILITKFDSIAHFDCIFWPYGKYLHDKVAHVLKHSQPSEISLDQTYVIQFGFMQKWTEVYLYIVLLILYLPQLYHPELNCLREVCLVSLMK